jgi:hypothetical protein
MTVTGSRGPLLALSFALAAISALPVLAFVGASSIAIGFSGLALLCMACAPVLWVVLTIGLLISFRKRALSALLGLPFVLASIALIGFVLLNLYGGTVPPGQYHIVHSEISFK